MDIKVMELGTLGDNPSGDSLVNYTNFLRSDHARFWFSNHQEYYGSFKSVMVSDTGPARGIMQRYAHFLMLKVLTFESVMHTDATTENATPSPSMRQSASPASRCSRR